MILIIVVLAAFKIPVGVKVLFIMGVIVRILLWNNKKKAFDGEGEDWREFKTPTEAYIKTTRHINEKYEGYDVEITKYKDGGFQLVLRAAGKIWDVIFATPRLKSGSTKPKKQAIDPDARAEAKQTIKEMKKYYK